MDLSDVDSVAWDGRQTDCRLDDGLAVGWVQARAEALDADADPDLDCC